MNVPTALASPTATAARVAEIIRARHQDKMNLKPVLAVWVGADDFVEQSFESAGIPHYATETEAVRGFMHVVRWSEARDALMQTPPSMPEQFSPDRNAARKVIDAALMDRRGWLDPLEISALFAAYGIPMVSSVLAANPDEAAGHAAEFIGAGLPVALKILSPDIQHKSDIGGVRLNLTTAPAVRSAAAEILDRARTIQPQARIAGVIVQPMIVRPQARELIAGFADDPTFGLVIVFGRGGTAVEVIDDKALALPPLDIKLAKRSRCAHQNFAPPQGLPQRVRRKRARDCLTSRQAFSARGRPARGARAGYQSSLGGRIRRARARRATCRCACGSDIQQPWASPLCSETLSEGVGENAHARRWYGFARTSRTARGRIDVSSIFQTDHDGRLKIAILRGLSVNSAIPSSPASPS